MIDKDRMLKFHKYNADELVTAMRDRVNVLCKEQGVEATWEELAETKTDWQKLIQNSKELHELVLVFNTRICSIESKMKKEKLKDER